ncbi:MAG: oligosaccharide flippase family protein [Planctomycetota bacterium]|jgi:O-antigen/teichoic acid export membrane protein
MVNTVKDGSRIQKVMRNVAFVTTSNLFSQTLLGFTGLVIIKYLGLSLYSEYSTAMLYMGMFSILGRLGFNRVFLRECSRETSLTSRYFGAALLLNGSLAVIGWIIALAIAYVRYDNRIFVLTVILGSGLLLMTLMGMARIVFQSHQKMHFMAISSVISTSLYCILFFTAIALKASVFVLAGLHLAMNLINFILSYGFSFRLAFPSLDFAIVKDVFRMGKQFCIISIMTIFYAQSCGFILAFLDLGKEVGIYNAAFRVYALIPMITHIIDSAMSPAIYNASMEPERMMRGVKLAIRHFTILGILIASIFIGRADWLMVTVFEAEFQSSAIILKILGLSLIFKFIIFLFQNIIYAKNKEKFMTVIISCLAIFTIISGVIFVPRYGGFAAALIFLISEGLLATTCFVKSERLLGYPGFWKLFIVPGIAGAITTAFLYSTSRYPLTGLVLSPIVFLGILFLTRYYHLTEVSFLFRMFVRPN